ncbi:MAG: SDR family NAD(P)-dependent oxidoreductase [Thermodesulfobacteriota bacterium]
MVRLKEKVAVITGGARGIGKQIALTFASEGADIVIGDVIEMDSTAQEIMKLGRKVITVKTDVTKKADVANLVETTIKNFKKVDILVNDAGITRPGKLLEITEENWDAVFNVNLKGVFLCTQAAARHMVEEKYGKIVSIASMAGLRGFTPNQAIYGPSKAGVVQFTRICAVQLGPYGINVNAIAPGVIKTDILSTGRSPEEVQKIIERGKGQAALRRIGTTQDIANVALFLASDESSFITGQVISADGGYLSSA